jgi:hypothetical protein
MNTQGLECLKKLQESFIKNKPKYLIPYFFLIELEGHTFNLRKHFQFEPVFALQRPKQFVLMCARQVGKSYSISAKNILLSWLVPGYKSLFVLPRFEQTKRLSNDVVKVMVESSPYKNLFTITGEQSTLRRPYKNNSLQYFQYAFLDPERIRGISGIHDLYYDECVSASTRVTYDSNKQISEITSPTFLDSMDNDMYVVNSVGNASTYRGIRNCFRIVLENGMNVEATIDHLFPTNKGWKTVEELVNSVIKNHKGNQSNLHRAANSINNGDITGGWERGTNKSDKWSLSNNAWLETTQIQLPQIPDITKVFFKRTLQNREQRLRELLINLQDPFFSNLCLYTHPMLSSRKETDNQGVVRSTNSRRTGLVDDGRRDSAQHRTVHRSINSFLFNRRSNSSSKLPKNKIRSRGIYAYSKKERKRISSNSFNSQRNTHIYPAYTSVHLRGDAVQGELEEQNMSSLRRRDIRPRKRMHARMYRYSKERISTPILSKKQGEERCAIQGMETKEQGSNKQTKQGSILCRPRRKQKKRSRSCLSLQRKRSRKSIRNQKAISYRTQRRSFLYSKSKRAAQALLHKTKRGSQEIFGTFTQTEKTPQKVIPSRIVKIEYIGPQPVYDISVVGTNTFFANGIATHNCQDMNWEFVPVINEVTTAVERWGFLNYSGTPKTLDNTLTSLFEESSQAEWVIKCEHCNKYNIPAIDHDLIKMIGKKTCICSSCGRPLDCSKGQFVHRFPKRRHLFSGLHISQITHPIHYTREDKWADVLYKMRTYPQYRFYNEILGVPCDSSEKLISQTELQRACSREEEDNNTLERALEVSRGCDIRAIGVDWGGGGAESASYTAIVLAGSRTGQENIEIFYSTKLNRTLSSWEQAQYIVDLVKKFSPHFLAHDYGGAGVDKETILIQAGMPIDKIIPFTYVMSHHKPIINYNKPQDGYRSSYSLDKMRSIVVLTSMIKAGKIKFPRWDAITDVDLGYGPLSLLDDFLYINAERFERPRGSDVILITKSPRKSDDFVHAVNYAASCIWYTRGAYPNIAEAESMRLTAEEVAEFHPQDPYAYF